MDRGGSFIFNKAGLLYMGATTSICPPCIERSSVYESSAASETQCFSYEQQNKSQLSQRFGGHFGPFLKVCLAVMSDSLNYCFLMKWISERLVCASELNTSCFSSSLRRSLCSLQNVLRHDLSFNNRGQRNYVSQSFSFVLFAKPRGAVGFTRGQQHYGLLFSSRQLVCYTVRRGIIAALHGVSRNMLSNT